MTSPDMMSAPALAGAELEPQRNFMASALDSARLALDRTVDYAGNALAAVNYRKLLSLGTAVSLIPSTIGSVLTLTEGTAVAEGTPDATATTAPPLHSRRYMEKNCPIVVEINVDVPGGSAGNKRGLSVRGQKIDGDTAGNSLSYPVVDYTWHLSKKDQLCGIVGAWYGPKYVSLRPTSQTANGGEYTDLSQKDAASPKGSLQGFFVYARPASH
jgi:hypothetical protein